MPPLKAFSSAGLSSMDGPSSGGVGGGEGSSVLISFCRPSLVGSFLLGLALVEASSEKDR